MRIIFLIFISLAMASCNEFVRRVADEAVKTGIEEDSLLTEQNEKPISINHHEVLLRLKKGEDSIFLVRDFFLTGERYAESWYRNDLRDSVSRFYYKSGPLSHTLHYKNGVVDEMLESYTPDGKDRSDSKLINGNGNLKLYHPVTLKLIADFNISNGYRNGEFKTWYSDGSKYESCTFANDTLIGPFTVWHLSGAVKVMRAALPGANTYTYSSFYPRGKPESCEIRQKIDGTLVSLIKFDEAGNISEKGVAANGFLKTTRYFYNSLNKMTSRGSYVDGKKNGSFEYFYESGKKRSLETYVDDMISAETMWYENGNVKKKANYKNGSYDGWYLEYYSNGLKRIEQQYAEGVKHGQYKSYFENGNKYYEGLFDNGKPIGEMKVYSRDGTFKRSKKYE